MRAENRKSKVGSGVTLRDHEPAGGGGVPLFSGRGDRSARFAIDDVLLLLDADPAGLLDLHAQTVTKASLPLRPVFSETSRITDRRSRRFAD